MIDEGFLTSFVSTSSCGTEKLENETAFESTSQTPAAGTSHTFSLSQYAKAPSPWWLWLGSLEPRSSVPNRERATRRDVADVSWRVPYQLERHHGQPNNPRVVDLQEFRSLSVQSQTKII